MWKWKRQYYNWHCIKMVIWTFSCLFIYLMHSPFISLSLFFSLSFSFSLSHSLSLLPYFIPVWQYMLTFFYMHPVDFNIFISISSGVLMESTKHMENIMKNATYKWVIVTNRCLLRKCSSLVSKLQWWPACRFETYIPALNLHKLL